MEEYIGIVKLFAGNYAPKGWAICDGSLLSITRYSALYALLTTTYGGDGRTTFGLPDLRGRTIMGAGEAGSATAAGQVAQAGTVATAKVAPVATGGVELASLPYLGLNYIICLTGEYPVRP